MQESKNFNEKPQKSSFFKKHKGPILISIGLVFVVGILVVAGWQIFLKKPGIPSQFSLEALSSDAAGINSETTFILTSSQSLSKQIIKQILKFVPEIEFSVKKHTKTSLISNVLAQTKEGRNETTSFEIKPEQSLEKNEVYQVAISDPDYAEREYSWAFQVKAEFQVIRTHPRDKGTYVPVNSGIEIVFNRENLINPQEYFSINPSTDGTFEQHGNTLIFLPKQLTETTIYTVTIKKGLRSEGSNDTLKEDYVFAFETGEHKYTGQKPYFDFRNDFSEFVPYRKPAFEVSYYNLNPDNLEINVYKLVDIDEFLNSYQESRRWQLNWTRHYWRKFGSAYKPNKDQKVLSFNPIVIKSGYQKFVEIPQELEEGYYVLDVEVEGVHNQLWLQITSLTHYFSLSYGKSLLWMYDFRKKEPIVNSEVSFYNQDSDSSILGTTNKDGLLTFSTPDILKDDEDKDDHANPSFFKVEHENYLPLLVRVENKWSYYSQKLNQGDSYWDYLSTDRYTYQMNDAVKFWGVVKGRQEDLRQKKVKVGIYKGYYWGGYYDSMGGDEPLVFKEVLVSQFDTIEGALLFKGIPPGNYSVTVSTGDDVISRANIQILTYTKPAYQVVVTSSKKAVFAGEKVDFKVKASFFDGTPVSKLQLKYNAYWRTQISGELTLNQSGEGVLSLTPEYYDDTYYPRSFSVTFSPKLSEEGEMWGRSQVLVFGPNIYAQSFQEKQDGDVYKFTAKLNHIVLNNQTWSDSNCYWCWRGEYVGDPAGDYPISAKIIKRTNYKIETGQYYDPINKITKKTYRWNYRDETIDELPGATNNEGEWSFVRELPKEENVNYRVVFSGRGTNGREFSTTSYAWHYYYESWKNFAISLNVGGESRSKEFSVGDKVEVELEVLEGDVPANAKVLFYRYQSSIDQISIESDLVFLEEFDKQFIPSVRYRAVILGPYGFEESSEVMASFKEEDNNLTINIKPDKEKYRPGEKANIEIEVKDRKNRAISAEVNLAVVDESLFHILPYDWQTRILDSLYQNISIRLITGASQYVFLEEKSVAAPVAESGGCFAAGTPILMVNDSFKPIEKVRVGDRILTFENEVNPSLKPAVVQGISRHAVNGYLIINNFLKVTPEHRLYVNGKWQYAGNIETGDMLIGINGLSHEVYSIEMKQERILVYNIVVGKYHTYFAGGYFVHNEEKGGGSPRANFVDVALYKTVHTDDSGKATADFVVPDNITAWRITAIAFSSEDLKAGEKIKLVQASLPFFVDTTLNNYYLVGDKPILRLRVFGDDYRFNQQTLFGIKSDLLNLDRQESSKDNFIYIPLEELSEGDYELVVSAEQGALEDSMIKEIKVVKSYFRKSESSFYELSESLSDIEGNDDGFTKLVFMDAGKGKVYSSLLRKTYIRGIRADQLAAHYFGEKLLAQYFKESEPFEDLDLSGYHMPEGGLTLFPYGDSELELSAKMADLAPEFVFQDNLSGYFNGVLQDKKTDIHRIAKALYGLASLKEPVLVKVNLVKNNKDLTFEDRVYLALALAKLGDKESARRIYEQDIKGHLRFQGVEAWLAEENDITKRVKLTGTIAVLVSYLNIENDGNVLWKYISTHNPEKDLDVLEEILFTKSELERLSRSVAQAKEEKTRFSYKTNKRQDSIELEKSMVFSLILPEDELKTMRFSAIEGKISLVSFYERSIDPEELAKNDELSLTREYLVNNSSTKSFNEGDVVLVRLDPKIAESAIDGFYQIIDYLPSGLKPITQLYRLGFSGGTECNPVWYPSKIINNIVYFSIYKGFNKTQRCSNRTINYYARVVSRGEYKANSAIIQSLKDLESLNISTKDSIEIK